MQLHIYDTMKRINRKNTVIILTFFLFIGITVEEPYTDFNYYNYTVNESYIEEAPLDYIVLDAQYTDSVLHGI
ncbi:Uncharacterised protein [uncultured archaeon]|nr:Uncharacterised protein [uncultured archaeon]